MLVVWSLTSTSQAQRNTFDCVFLSEEARIQISKWGGFQLLKACPGQL